MDHQWGLARTAAAQQQQGDVASQYSYSSSSYPGQQAGTPSPATSAMYAQPQGYSQQTYIQQTYAQQQQATAASAQVGYGSNANNHGAISTGAHMSAQQQQQVAWSQQASVQGAQQADQSQGTYGRSATGLTPVMGTGTVSAATAATIQYAGQYGAIYAAAPAAQPSGQQMMLHTMLRFQNMATQPNLERWPSLGRHPSMVELHPLQAMVERVASMGVQHHPQHPTA